jgi:ADP-L-glycero-D-manno-heptose 6-epimerase
MQNSSGIQRILVTGAAGFIGARTVEAAQKKGLQVISVDTLAYFKDRPEHGGLDFGTRVDRDELFRIWDEGNLGRVDAILHLGAITDTTEMDVELLRKLNIEYSQKLWERATRSKIPMIYASSAATYGEGEKGYQDDESLIPELRPLNPYGESKRLFDLWVLEQEKMGTTPPAWSGFKFFNVYGYGERHKGKMASVVLHSFDKIKKDGTAKLFRSHRAGIADGEQKRDFISVEDVVSVLFFALEKPIRRGIFNLGTGQARSFLDLARATFKSLQLSERVEWVDTPIELRERYQYFTQAEMSRLRKEGFTQSFLTLEEGVARYIKRLQNPPSHAKH